MSVRAAFPRQRAAAGADPRHSPGRPSDPRDPQKPRHPQLDLGVVEPLVVHPQAGGAYLLLEGHLRLDVLKELGVAEANCLVATADEGYT
jgi:ParB/Sulfiredoxin domain